MAEIMRGAPGGFRGGDYEEFARALDEVLSLDAGELEDWAGLLAEHYAWDKVAQRTVQVYRSVF
jgi:glycosyltransferase involved in cell wall biosynthesis